jgi:hypothetical protein
VNLQKEKQINCYKFCHITRLSTCESESEDVTGRFYRKWGNLQNPTVFELCIPQDAPDRNLKPRNGFSGRFQMLLINGCPLSTLRRPRNIGFPPRRNCEDTAEMCLTQKLFKGKNSQERLEELSLNVISASYRS